MCVWKTINRWEPRPIYLCDGKQYYYALKLRCYLRIRIGHAIAVTDWRSRSPIIIVFRFVYDKRCNLPCLAYNVWKYRRFWNVSRKTMRRTLLTCVVAWGTAWIDGHSVDKGSPPERPWSARSIDRNKPTATHTDNWWIVFMGISWVVGYVR